METPTAVPLNPPAWFDRVATLANELAAQVDTLPPGTDYTLLCRLRIRLDFVIQGMVTDLLRLSLREEPQRSTKSQC